MSQVVSAWVLRLVCQHGGSLDLKTLDESLKQRFTVAETEVVKVLGDFETFVVVGGGGGEGPDSVQTSTRGEDRLVLAKTSVRVCRTLPGQCDGACQNLHLCKYEVCGNCRFRERCKNCHDLNSAHNSTILSKVGLQHLGKSELFQLLLQNDPFLLPEVCIHYNRGTGEHGSCKYQTSCTNLHVCQHFLQDDCKFGTECKKAHSFDASAIKIFNGRGLSPENIRNFHKIYKIRFQISSYKEKPAVQKNPVGPKPVAGEGLRLPSTSPASEIDANEICLFYIRGECSFKDKCVRLHCHLPYKWQVLDKNGQTWKDLPNEGDIERTYCNPANDVSPGPQAVNFMSMTCGKSPVRRLSTASSVTKPPHFILTTEWFWYWKNEKGEWNEYGQGMDEKLTTTLTSKSIENIYQSDPESEISSSSQEHTYILYLKEMYQQNTVYKTQRDIRRRPRFVSALEVKTRLKSESTGSPSLVVPAHWDRGALPNFSYKLVSVSKTEAEFVKVETLFKQTMPNHTIVNMQRNQNISLWKVFQWQKEQMNGRNGGRDVNERLLFHGTNESLIDAICDQNFDWRICGKHGTLYGKGSYFARDASYSDGYSQSAGTTVKKMFVARVLVGHYTRGDSTIVRPPVKTSGKGFYDSCVDDLNNPSIFVVFEKFQVYPEFVIEYSPVESKCVIS